jgi:hypothetical protein
MSTTVGASYHWVAGETPVFYESPEKPPPRPKPSGTTRAPEPVAAAADGAAPKAVLSPQFLFELAATHHRAEMSDQRDAMRRYTGKYQALLADEQEEAHYVAYEAGKGRGDAAAEAPPTPRRIRRKLSAARAVDPLDAQLAAIADRKAAVEARRTAMRARGVMDAPRAEE